jgi:hypothetical protein
MDKILKRYHTPVPRCSIKNGDVWKVTHPNGIYMYTCDASIEDLTDEIMPDEEFPLFPNDNHFLILEQKGVKVTMWERQRFKYFKVFDCRSLMKITIAIAEHDIKHKFFTLVSRGCTQKK